MDRENQIIKLYRVCGFEREYDAYHRLYAACKNFASIRSAKHYKKIEKKILEKSRLYRENNKEKLKQSRKSIKTHTEVIQDLYNKINTLTEKLNVLFVGEKWKIE